MNKIKLFFISSMLFCGTIVYSQDIKLKKDLILLDNKSVLNYKKTDMASKFQVYKIDSSEEILFINQQTIPDGNGLYWKFYFPIQNKFFYKKIINSFKSEIKLMFEDKVIDEKGNINEDKLDLYINKYNEL